MFTRGYVPRITQKSWDLPGDIHHKEVGGPRMEIFAYMELVTTVYDMYMMHISIEA